MYSFMQLNNTYREKLLNAVIFFSKNVKFPSKLKIFKLLYFLDFKHFKETGKSVTNLDYYALDFGPVPISFYDEISDNEVPQDFSKFITIDPFKSDNTGKKGGIIKPKSKPNLKIFTPREQRIMKDLADIFRDVDAKVISDVSHFKNHPWDKTRKEKGINKKIDYLLAIDNEANLSLEEAIRMVKEREELLRAFPLKNKIS